MSLTTIEHKRNAAAGGAALAATAGLAWGAMFPVAKHGLRQADRRHVEGVDVIFGAVIAVLSWNSAVQRLGAPTAVLFNNLVPITAFVIAIAGGYAPNAYELGGAALPIVALAAVTALNRASAPAAATPARDRPRSPVAAGPRRAAAASAYAHTRSR
jgi:hypothetical protein